MKVTNEKTEQRQAYLTVELESTEVEEFLGKAYKRMVGKVVVPGFRKGKTPRDIFERYVGREGLLDEAIKDMVPDTYVKAVKQEGLEPVAQPQFEVSSTEPFIFKATVPLQPVVKLGDYHQIRVAEEKVTVTDDQVNNVLENMRHQHAVWEPVERPTETNDQVTINLKSDVDGVPFFNRLNLVYQILPEQNYPVAGFAEQLTGMKAGETKQFKLTLPEDYGVAEMAGKEASFEVTVNEIKVEKLPDLNDELATQVGAQEDIKTVDALRVKVREEVQKQSEEVAKRNYEQKAVDELVKLAEMEYPPVMLESEIDSLIRDQLQQYQIPEERWGEFLQSLNKTNEQYREELKPVATKRLAEAISMGEVAKLEKVEFTDAEVDAEVEKMVNAMAEENRDRMRQVFENEQSRQSIRRMYMGRRTMDKLVEIAKGTVADTGQTGKEEQQ